ncbi:hypothetical protein F3Y22_tig00111213pilonHSYRG00600 [Hibiscus syriacus]|uniref:NPH3 domain-containing protein n=1 Tax=Hibiscus syriacus TaxID=106335 RepID=A0A6A2YV23_HIBSY|nr:hypothetical protein F3Y22_tig00111213pilonHSYRG00600 [Hibiscus syriacus]
MEPMGLCWTGLPSDLVVEVRDMAFHLHKFPLLSRSLVIADRIKDYCGLDGKKCVLQFHHIPGGAKTFLLVAKFCYGIRLELNAMNIVGLRWPLSENGTAQCPEGNHVLWNGICTTAKPQTSSEDWWYEDVSFRLRLYKRQSSFQSRNNAAPVSTTSHLSDMDQRHLLEEIVALIPTQKGATPTNFLLRLLRTSMILRARPPCQEKLERQIGAQLDQAALEDLLIPNIGYSMETLYDIDCVQRILDHFIRVDQESLNSSSSYVIDEGQLMGGSHPLTPMTMVATLVDGYLAEVAPDINLKLPKFQSLAAVIPDYVRPSNDGIYSAIDIYLKAHPWLIDSEREQICGLMNCQKLSLEASTHATQNEWLPLRFIVQVIFFEQLRLWTSRNPTGIFMSHT